MALVCRALNLMRAGTGQGELRMGHLPHVPVLLRNMRPPVPAILCPVDESRPGDAFEGKVQPCSVLIAEPSIPITLDTAARAEARSPLLLPNRTCQGSSPLLPPHLVVGDASSALDITNAAFSIDAAIAEIQAQSTSNEVHNGFSGTTTWTRGDDGVFTLVNNDGTQFRIALT